MQYFIASTRNLPRRHQVSTARHLFFPCGYLGLSAQKRHVTPTTCLTLLHTYGLFLFIHLTKRLMCYCMYCCTVRILLWCPPYIYRCMPSPLKSDDCGALLRHLFPPTTAVLPTQQPPAEYYIQYIPLGMTSHSQQACPCPNEVCGA